jgi:hypothetical protein
MTTEEIIRDAEAAIPRTAAGRDGQMVEWLAAKLAEARRDNERYKLVNLVNAELIDEKAFNEGLTEHIGDLLEAIAPFAALVSTTNGRISTGRLSFADWHKLSKVYKAAKDAMSINGETK